MALSFPNGIPSTLHSGSFVPETDPHPIHQIAIYRRCEHWDPPHHGDAKSLPLYSRYQAVFPRNQRSRLGNSFALASMVLEEYSMSVDCAPMSNGFLWSSGFPCRPTRARSCAPIASQSRTSNPIRTTALISLGQKDDIAIQTCDSDMQYRHAQHYCAEFLNQDNSAFIVPSPIHLVRLSSQSPLSESKQKVPLYRVLREYSKAGEDSGDMGFQR
jgi:hypothetical protein